MGKTNDIMEAELKELFRRYDADGNGVIDRGEFEALLKALGVFAAPDRVAAQFASIDRDGNGDIDYDEFVAWWLAL